MTCIKAWTLFRTNIRLLGVGFLVVLSIIACRAYYLQVLQADWLKQRTEAQRAGRVHLLSHRGTIYDCKGTELAVSNCVGTAAVRPSKIIRKEPVARQIATAINLPYEEVLDKLNASQSYTWIDRKISPAESTALRKLQISGLDIQQTTRRYYPMKELAAHIVGFAGVDNQGLEGIERCYDRMLRGQARSIPTLKDSKMRSLIIDAPPAPEKTRGSSLTLTIDATIQHIVQRELSAAVHLSEAAAGMAVVLEPDSGRILAMETVPTFNPNDYQNFSNTVYRNRPVTDMYEPGSTFKPLVVAAALDSGTIAPDDMFDCENGAFRVGRRTIHDIHPHDLLSVGDILKYSSNIGISKIACQLGTRQMHDAITRFGFGQRTGIKFPGETAGRIPPAQNLPQHTLSAISFGQGIAVSALQLACAYATLANGGLLLRPLLVDHITDGSGQVVQRNTPQRVRRVLSARSAATVTAMLERVVSADGTGARAAVPGYRVAGKTGTSQKIDPDNGGYCTRQVMASFAGFAPVSRPRIVVLVIIDEPARMAYGGEIAAPTFSRICQQVLNYLQVPFDQPAPVRQTRHTPPREKRVG